MILASIYVVLFVSRSQLNCELEKFRRRSFSGLRVMRPSRVLRGLRPRIDGDEDDDDDDDDENDNVLT